MYFYNNRHLQHGSVFWKHQYPPYLHQSKQLSQLLAEGTMTCISLVAMFVFPARWSTSHRGDKAILGLSLVPVCSAVSPVRCCACCSAPLPYQPYIEDWEWVSSPKPPSRPLLTLVLDLLLHLWDSPVQTLRALTVQRSCACSWPAPVLLLSSATRASSQLSSRKCSIYRLSDQMSFPRCEDLVAHLLCQPAWRVRRGTSTCTHAVGCCVSQGVFCGW